MLAFLQGKQIKHGSVEVMINDKRQDQIKKGRPPVSRIAPAPGRGALRLTFQAGQMSPLFAGITHCDR